MRPEESPTLPSVLNDVFVERFPYGFLTERRWEDPCSKVCANAVRLHRAFNPVFLAWYQGSNKLLVWKLTLIELNTVAKNKKLLKIGFWAIFVKNNLMDQ